MSESVYIVIPYGEDCTAQQLGAAVLTATRLGYEVRVYHQHGVLDGPLRMLALYSTPPANVTTTHAREIQAALHSGTVTR